MDPFPFIGSLFATKLNGPSPETTILLAGQLSILQVQISPQYMKLRLRLGQSETVRFSVRQSQHYPVDLYYLMDLSNSMSDDRENIVRLGQHIASAIENITKDRTDTDTPASNYQAFKSF